MWIKIINYFTIQLIFATIHEPPLYFLTLFMDPNFLFKLIFTFVYNTSKINGIQTYPMYKKENEKKKKKTGKEKKNCERLERIARCNRI